MLYMHMYDTHVYICTSYNVYDDNLYGLGIKPPNPQLYVYILSVLGNKHLRQNKTDWCLDIFELSRFSSGISWIPWAVIEFKSLKCQNCTEDWVYHPFSRKPRKELVCRQMEFLLENTDCKHFQNAWPSSVVILFFPLPLCSAD